MTSSVLIVLAVLVGLAFIAVLWGAGIYNQLVTLKNRYQLEWRQYGKFWFLEVQGSNPIGV